MEMEVSELAASHMKLALKGRLDTAGVDSIEARLTATIVPRGQHVLLDLSQVDFVASMGVRMLISIARALGRKSVRLVLFAAQEGVAEVFESVSLGDIIAIRASEGDALAALEA
jgi:anti-sigma B factor antagonist